MKQHLFASASMLVATALATVTAQADTIDLVKGEYGAFATAQAHTETDEEKYQGTSTNNSFFKGAQASASYADPQTDLHTAYAAGSVSWDRSAPNVLTAGVGGYAEAFSWGLDTAAAGGGSLQLYFDLNSDVKASLVYEGTYDSQLYRLEDGNWQQVGSWVAWDNFDLAKGSYRWNGAAGESVNGSNAYGSGMFFTLTVTPVPELPSLALVLGGLALLGTRLKAR